MSFAYFSPSGKLVVTAAGYCVQIWDIAGGRAGRDGVFLFFSFLFLSSLVCLLVCLFLVRFFLLVSLLVSVFVFFLLCGSCLNVCCKFLQLLDLLQVSMVIVTSKNCSSPPPLMVCFFALVRKVR